MFTNLSITQRARLTIVSSILGHLLLFFSESYFFIYTDNLSPTILAILLAIVGVILLLWSLITSIQLIIRYLKMNEGEKTKNDTTSFILSLIALLLLVSARYEA
ncbi:MAG: hypothetical protein ACJAR8_001438 [Bacteroidia bacterium]|jgi:hypothetical protein